MLQTRYSSAILAEYRVVLSRPKFNFRAKDIQGLINGIIRAGLQVNAIPSIFFMPDESDRTFYDTAKTAGAILITGNSKHYPNEPFILTPAIFVQKYFSRVY
jgi:predicted nucleic acid-binding protein